MLSEIGLGLSAVSSIAGLLGASSAQKAAEERRNRIITDLKNQNAREYLDVTSGNAYGLGARSGELNDALVSSGRSLGAANAAAGVTNNTAVAGSLGLGQQSITKALTDYALRNKYQEQQLLDRQQSRIAGLEMGNAEGDLGYQRDQTAGYLGSFGNLLSGIGQLGKAPGGAAPSTEDLSGGLLPPGVGIDDNLPFGPPNVPLGGWGGPSTRTVNPLQSAMQLQTQKNRRRLGGLDVRTMGDMTNGMQGSTLPSFGV